MLAATPLTFQVVDDAATNISYRYAANGTPQGTSTLVAANAAPRGAASTVAADKTWVIDANRNVYVYHVSGGLLGSWTAGSLANNAAPEGIATDGTDIWIVDGKSDKVFRYAGAASRLSGSQTAASSFTLASGNANPKDMVADGASLWIVDDTAKTDKVFKYSVAGSYVGSWTIDAANKAPTGITLDPGNIGDMSIADSGTDRVYKYSAAASRNSGSQAAATSFALTTGNGNAQGLVIPGRPWAETPYAVSWVRQFGTAADDWGRGVSVDTAGNIYVSGATYGSLATSNPSGAGTPYLARFDAAGNTTWVRQATPIPGADHEGVRVAADSLGNVFQVVGVGSDGSGAGLSNYDVNGTLRWTVTLPLGENIFNVATDDLGYAYMATYEGNNFHLRKFEAATGNVVWHQTVNTGGYVNASGVSADHMGNIYVAAYTAGSVLGPNAGGYDALLVKFTDAGTMLWSRQFGTAQDDLAFQVATDQVGNVYTSGRTFGSLGGPNAGYEDTFLAKHDSAGNLLWTRQFGTSGNEGSNGSSSSWIDASGNIYRAMGTDGALGGAHLGDSDIVVAKYAPTGDMLWATQLGTTGLDLASGGISGDAEGNLYVSGRTAGSMGGTNAGGLDAVLIKLTPPAASVSGSSVSSLNATAMRAASADSLSSEAIGTTSMSASSPISKPISINTANNTTTSAAARAQTDSLLLMSEAAVRLSAKAADSALAKLGEDGSHSRDSSLDDELLLDLVTGHPLFRAF